MVKPEKFDHLHLFYHFTVPLSEPKCHKNKLYEIQQRKSAN